MTFYLDECPIPRTRVTSLMLCYQCEIGKNLLAVSQRCDLI